MAPGLFDEHGRLRKDFDWPVSESPERTRLTFGTNPGEKAFEEVAATLSDYPVNRLKADFDPTLLEGLRQVLAGAVCARRSLCLPKPACACIVSRWRIRCDCSPLSGISSIA